MSEQEVVRKRYLDALFDAWPEHAITREDAAASLSIVVGQDSDDGHSVKVTFGYMGRTTELGFDGSLDGVLATVDDVARLHARDAEDDRWTSGGAWREYKP